ncbi:hypothetical protein I7I53_00730 [Histoplasma capsulatum var. duboisii H88]|uniref:Uncharacterized protein n=1 Tax=Ajellomyces capsulatus (strain H88) TaxID=544711 RepID=A0A8A1LJ10_AJEC8|nr:hypothetical protein I7I53_00730 [Histoplasma capsulatum var. duboisii H88]
MTNQQACRCEKFCVRRKKLLRRPCPTQQRRWDVQRKKKKKKKEQEEQNRRYQIELFVFSFAAKFYMSTLCSKAHFFLSQRHGLMWLEG